MRSAAEQTTQRKHGRFFRTPNAKGSGYNRPGGPQPNQNNWQHHSKRRREMTELEGWWCEGKPPLITPQLDSATW